MGQLESGFWNLLFVFLFFLLRMKSSPAERSWALRSSSPGQLPDDDSKHGWAPRGTNMYTILTPAQLRGEKNVCTTHTSSGRNSLEENNMNECEKEKRVEVVKRLQMACYTHLSLMRSYACFFFTLCNGKFLSFARDLGISCVHTSLCKKTSICWFIVPAVESVNSHMDSYIFAKAVKHTCTCPPGFCMCTGPFELEEFSSWPVVSGSHAYIYNIYAYGL